MGQLQLRALDPQIAGEQQVEVERARAVARRIEVAARGDLDALAEAQQFERRSSALRTQAAAFA